MTRPRARRYSEHSPRPGVLPMPGGWRIFINGKDYLGRRKPHTRRIRGSYAAAEAAYAELLDAIKAGAPPGKHTVGNHMARWLRSIEPDIEPSTYRRYASLSANHIVPALGALRLADVSVDALEDWKAHLRSTGLSARSQQYAWTTLSSALKQARAWGLVRENACNLIRGPKGGGPKVVTAQQVLTREEARKLLAALAAEDSVHAASLSLALLTGLRMGEVLAIRTPALEMAMGELSVSHSLQWLPRSEPRIKGTKTGKAVTIDLGPAELEVIARVQARGNVRSLAFPGLLFVAPDGQPLREDMCWKLLQRVLVKAGLKRRRVHDLRHTWATLMLSSGAMELHQVSKRMGHSDPAFTAKVYTAFLRSDQKEAVAKFSAWLKEG